MSYHVAEKSHAEKMNLLYSTQRHVYDLSRKYYLLGRDTLLDLLPVHNNSHICEIGTGTARNLIKLAHKNTQAQFYGLDISSEMLKTARSKVSKLGLESKISLIQGDAEHLDHKQFGLTESFNTIFFSYSLSIMPDETRVNAIQQAWNNLQPEGSLWVIDFGDLLNWPSFIQTYFKKWLQLYHVEYRKEIFECLQQLSPHTFESHSIRGRYAILAGIKKSVLPK